MLAEFQKNFLTRRAALVSFGRRWPDGFVCPACGRKRAVALKSRPCRSDCLDCGRQTSLIAGTAMHRSKLPRRCGSGRLIDGDAFNGMSARQLEDELGDTDKTAWLLAREASALDGRSRSPSSEASSRCTRRHIPFRANDAFFEPVAAGKIRVAAGSK